jgi:hypothetical protein
MLDIDQIRDKLQDRVASRVAEATGLHRNTVAAIKSGEKKTATRATIALLSSYLQGASNE